MILSKMERGTTLLEIMLVLAIAASILLMSLSQYYGYQNQRNIAVVQANVDQLFLAAALYYKANCNGFYDNTGTLTPGTLNPAVLADLVDPVPITTAQLIAGNYLSGWNPANPLIDSTTPGLDYIVQFNPVVNSGVSVNITNAWQSGGPTPIPATQAKTLLWRIQVSVLLSDPTPTQWTFYKGAMNADCISGLNGSIVNTCNSGPTAAGYLAWERLPSYASPKVSSSLTQSMPLLKEFNLQYTHDQMYELNSGNATVQYYLCGG